MGRFHLFGLFQILKAFKIAITRDNTKVAIVSNKFKNSTTIKFKNGSYIKVLTPKEGKNVRGNRAKLYPRPSEDFMPDWYIDNKILDEALTPFYVERESNNLDGQILYMSSRRKQK